MRAMGTSHLSIRWAALGIGITLLTALTLGSGPAGATPAGAGSTPAAPAGR